MARGAITITASTTPTILAAGSVYAGVKKLSTALIKNNGSSTVYLQWTEEDDELTASNGYPLESGTTMSLEFPHREDKRYAPPIKALVASGSADLIYVIE